MKKKRTTRSMNITANFEHRAGSSQSKHEGEPSFALCDRLSRIRDNSQRQLPTDHDYAVPTREYQTDQSSLNLPRLLLALSSRKSKNNYKNTHRLAELTRSLHIRASHSLKRDITQSIVPAGWSANRTLHASSFQKTSCASPLIWLFPVCP